MASAEHSALTRKLSAFVALSEAELAVLERLHQRRRTFGPGRDMVHQGQSDQAAYILASGWVCSYKIQPDGTRQIVDFQVPGDFLGLRSVLLRTSDHSFEPIATIEAAEVLKSDLLTAFAQTPRLATAILWAASRDEAMGSSISWGSAGATRMPAWRISCWSWARGWPSWASAARKDTTAR
jgi:CRP-like cAMP-binding protein